MASKITECDGGCIQTSSVTNLSTVNGIGNPVLPTQSAMTGAEQSSNSCIGSGDKWDGFSKNPEHKKSNKKKYVVGKKTKNGVNVLFKTDSIFDAKNKLKTLESKEELNAIKIYVID